MYIPTPRYWFLGYKSHVPTTWIQMINYEFQWNTVSLGLHVADVPATHLYKPVNV